MLGACISGAWDCCAPAVQAAAAPPPHPCSRCWHAPLWWAARRSRAPPPLPPPLPPQEAGPAPQAHMFLGHTTDGRAVTMPLVDGLARVLAATAMDPDILAAHAAGLPPPLAPPTTAALTAVFNQYMEALQSLPEDEQTYLVAQSHRVTFRLPGAPHLPGQREPHAHPLLLGILRPEAMDWLRDAAAFVARQGMLETAERQLRAQRTHELGMFFCGLMFPAAGAEPAGDLAQVAEAVRAVIGVLGQPPAPVLAAVEALGQPRAAVRAGAAGLGQLPAAGGAAAGALGQLPLAAIRAAVEALGQLPAAGGAAAGAQGEPLAAIRAAVEALGQLPAAGGAADGALLGQLPAAGGAAADLQPALSAAGAEPPGAAGRTAAAREEEAEGGRPEAGPSQVGCRSWRAAGRQLEGSRSR